MSYVCVTLKEQDGESCLNKQKKNVHESREQCFVKAFHFHTINTFFPFMIGRQSESGGLASPSEPLTSIPFMVCREQSSMDALSPLITLHYQTLKGHQMLLLNHPSLICTAGNRMTHWRLATENGSDVCFKQNNVNLNFNFFVNNKMFLLFACFPLWPCSPRRSRVQSPCSFDMAHHLARWLF